MRLRIEPVWNCCTAKVIGGFGGSNAAAHGRGAEYSVQELCDALEEAMGDVSRMGMGMAIAMITSQQTAAKEALEKMGWRFSNESNKDNHSDTSLLCYTWAVKPDNKQAIITNPFEGMKKVLVNGMKYSAKYGEVPQILGEPRRSSNGADYLTPSAISENGCYVLSRRRYDDEERVRQNEKAWYGIPRGMTEIPASFRGKAVYALGRNGIIHDWNWSTWTGPGTQWTEPEHDIVAVRHK